MEQGTTIAVVGASGYLGGLLCVRLEHAGYKVVKISRSRRDGDWRQWGAGCLDGVDVVFNFAGKSIDCRWSDQVKQELRDSRVDVCRQINDWIAEMPQEKRPQTLLSASGIGIFGNRGEEELSDDASEGEGFIADLCRDWEQAALSAEELGVRVVCMRFGAVLGRESKAWQKIALPYRFFVGGKLGDGAAYFSWIHQWDAVEAMVHAMETNELRGGVNFVSEACTHSYLAKQIGRALSRPAFFAVPEFAIKLMVGEFAEALLASINASSGELWSSGFTFQYPTIDTALDEIVNPED